MKRRNPDIFDKIIEENRVTRNNIASREREEVGPPTHDDPYHLSLS